MGLWSHVVVAVAVAVAMHFAYSSVGITGISEVHRPLSVAAFDAPEWIEFEGDFEPNEALAAAQQVVNGELLGPETAVLGPDGAVYTADRDGWIRRVSGWRDADVSSAATVERWAFVGGRPLGIAFDADGNLIVCEPAKGLVRVDGATREVSILASHSNDGQRILYADDLAISALDGRIYFSDASSIAPWSVCVHHGHREKDCSLHTMAAAILDGIEAAHTGRLLRYDPATGETEVLLSNLFFANGVALANDDSHVLVVETFSAHVRRLWLKGPRAGESEVFSPIMPVYPDGITSAPDGTFWVAGCSPRTRVLEMVHDNVWAKWLIAGMPAWLKPKPIPHGVAIQLDADGNVLSTLQDPRGTLVPMVTGVSVTPDNTLLLLGNLHGRDLNIVNLSPSS